MILSPEQQKLVARARSDLKTWRYERWVWLFLAFFAFGVAIDLQFSGSGSVFGIDSVVVLQAVLSALGLQGIVSTVQNWDNERARLLVRLSEDKTE